MIKFLSAVLVTCTFVSANATPPPPPPSPVLRTAQLEVIVKIKQTDKETGASTETEVCRAAGSVPVYDVTQSKNSHVTKVQGCESLTVDGIKMKVFVAGAMSVDFSAPEQKSATVFATITAEDEPAACEICGPRPYSVSEATEVVPADEQVIIFWGQPSTRYKLSDKNKNGSVLVAVAAFLDAEK